MAVTVDQTSIPSGFSPESHAHIFETFPRSNPRKPGQLTDEQLQSLRENGFLLVEDFFEPAELDKCKAEIQTMVDDLANKLFNAGKIKDKYEHLGFFERLSAIEKDFPGANVILHKCGRMPDTFRAIGQHEKLLNLMEDLLGPDITFNPVWNLRTKTPGSSATTVPWHQDVAYMDNSTYDVLLMAAWIPFLDTNEINGTLQYVKGAHKQAKVGLHTCCAGPTWYVMLEEDEMEKTLGAKFPDDVVTVPVRYGSFLLFNNYVPHRSLMNNSNVVRWTIDFRWQKTGTPDGLWGIKQGCPVRSGNDPNFQPDWETFDSVDRNKEQIRALATGEEDKSYEDEFNRTISGPWMKKWHIVNHNAHTESFLSGNENFQMFHG